MGVKTIRVTKNPLPQPMLRLVQGDANTQVIRFLVKKEFGGNDLYGLDWSVWVHGFRGEAEVSYIGHGTVSGDDIVLDWEVIPAAAKDAGITVLKLYGSNGGEGAEEYAWVSGNMQIAVTPTQLIDPGYDEDEVNAVRQLISDFSEQVDDSKEYVDGKIAAEKNYVDTTITAEKNYVDGEIASDRRERAALNTEIKNDQKVLGSRLSLLEAGTTPEGSEVIGIRTGADGVVDLTAGDSVRRQLNNLYKVTKPEMTVTNGKYAKYSLGADGDLSGVKLCVFDCRNITKILYTYTVSTSDMRGLYFLDVNGKLIAGYQTISTSQDITVPVGAVECHATVARAENIVCYDIYGTIDRVNTAAKQNDAAIRSVETDVIGSNSYDVLFDNSTHISNTSGGITYTWSSDNKKLTISGTRTGVSFTYLSKRGGTEIPAYLSTGRKYSVVFNPVNKAIACTFMWFKNGTNYKNVYVNSTTTIEIPEDATGLEIRIDVIGSGVTVNETVDHPQIKLLPPDNCILKRLSNVEGLDTTVNGSERSDVMTDSRLNHQSRTSYGVTFQWNDDNTECTISGTSAGNATSWFYISGNGIMPEGLEPNETYAVKHNGLGGKVALVFQWYVNGTNTHNTTIYTDSDVTVPDGVTSIKLNYLVITGVTVSGTIKAPHIYYGEYDMGLVERTENLESAVFYDEDNPIARIEKDPSMLRIFRHVGVIGDSLASGASVYKNAAGTNIGNDMLEQSWVQCLARATGNTYYNFTRGGLSTATWLGSTYDTQCFDGNHNCEAYFIGLGQNDKNAQCVVGTSADVNLTNYNQNADTFCGRYGKIIQRLKAHRPHAPIFCFTDPADNASESWGINTAIRSVVALFDEDVWLVDLKRYGEQYYSGTGFPYSELRGGHYSAQGYLYMSWIISTYVDWIIRHNRDKFKYIDFIGTDKDPWNDAV